MNQNSIGIKIRNYRIRAGMSQLDLELEIGAASGMISRIENGVVNPTKETLINLSKALNLNTKELSDLIGIVPLFPTEEEINAAINEVSDYLESEVRLAYLVDDRFTLRAASIGFLQFFGLTIADAPEYFGKPLIQIAFDPNLVVRKAIESESFNHFISIDLARAEHEIGISKTPEFNYLMQLPDFPVLWELSKTWTNEDIFSPRNKTVTFIVNGEKVNLNFTRERLKQNQRFEIVEFINPHNL